MNLSDMLENIALNNTYHGRALEDAYNHKVATKNDKDMLMRYLHGEQTSIDHIRLQELADYIRTYNDYN